MNEHLKNALAYINVALHVARNTETQVIAENPMHANALKTLVIMLANAADEIKNAQKEAK